MAEQGAISGDREQQRADNNASRRQSGLDPLPEDRTTETDERPTKDSGRESENTATTEDLKGK